MRMSAPPLSREPAGGGQQTPSRGPPRREGCGRTRRARARQEYDYHLAAVNTVTFVDEGRRFVTTSDDKTIRAWEFGIPVQIKYIADPGMHSVPAVSVHPNAQWLIGTSLDNQIVTYSAKDRFRQNRKKTFKVRPVAPRPHAPRW